MIITLTRQNGVTLIELMVTIAIVGIVVAFALPSFQAVVIQNQLATQTNAMVGGLYLARSEAIKRRAWVVLCRSEDGAQCGGSGGYETGWIVFVDRNSDAKRGENEEILRVFAKSPSQMKISGNGDAKDYISFAADGMNKKADGTFQANTLKVEIDRGGEPKTRCIMLSSGGRVRVDDCAT